MAHVMIFIYYISLIDDNKNTRLQCNAYILFREVKKKKKNFPFTPVDF